MSDEQKDRERGEEARPQPPEASSGNVSSESEERSRETRPRQDASGEETETLSLLDLMDEIEREKGKSASRPAASTAPDDQATATGPPIPTNLPRPTPKPLPPISRDKTITSQPPEKDENATDVQPGLAFPGATDPRFAARPSEKERPQQSPPQRPVSERPTEVFHHRPQPRAQQQQRAPQRQRPVPPRERPRPRYAVPPAQHPQSAERPHPAPTPRRSGPGCMTRVLLVGLLLLVVGLAMGGAGAVVAYTAIAADLPDDVSSQASHFETAIIYDREGNELYSLADPTTGNRTYVRLDQISPHLINATIATEDARFYTNPGFDPIGIGRAVVQAAQEREVVSGASTITQQLVRAVVLEEEERTQRTFSRKVREIVLAAELSRTTSKDKILELYLNEIFYGNYAYGIEAAAQGYFGKHAADLTLAEASLLAGLPQAPALYDPYTAAELALGRQAVVLQLMVDAGYITEADAQAAIDESAPAVRNLTPPRRAIEHPHFVFTVLQQLEDLLGAQSLYAGGLRVYTSLDPEVQRLAEAAVAAHRDDIRATGANNAALVALDPDTGEVLALVGSVDYRSEEIKGQVNMALAPRQPGSAIKPLVYASALEDGWTPSTLIWDVRTEFPDGANPEPYVPKNYDDEFHGPLRLRPALGNSYNVPAVKALEYVGVCEFIGDLRDLGINLADPGGCDDGQQPRNYGLALALGGGEISPLQMTSAYATLANDGQYIPPFTIRRIENSRGEVQFTYEPPPAPPTSERAVRPAHAFLLSNILSDNEARQPEFGADNRLVIAGHQVAAKTGTSGSTRYDVRDGWTLGYTPRIAAGVWVGNTDPSPVKEGVSGYQMAAPIWNDFMRSYLAGKEAVSFAAPEDVVRLEICAASGTRPGPGCSQVIGEYFAADQLPEASEADFVQQVPVDLWTGLVANEFCNEAVYNASFVNLLVSGREEVAARELANARAWIEETSAGEAWANARGIRVPLRLPPTDACGADTPRPRLSLMAPSAGSEIMGETQVRGTAMAPDFAGYVVDFGLSHDPGGWGPVQGLQTQPVQDGILAIWDTTDVSFQGPVTVRLTVFGPDNPYTPEEDRVTAEARLLLTLQQPTPTATATATTTPTPTVTPTPTATPSPTMEVTPTVTTTPPPGGEGGGEGAETTPSP